VLLVGLVITAYLGFVAGEIASDAASDDLAAWIAALTTWGMGLWISIVLFNRTRRPPG